MLWEGSWTLFTMAIEENLFLWLLIILPIAPAIAANSRVVVAVFLGLTTVGHIISIIAFPIADDDFQIAGGYWVIVIATIALAVFNHYAIGKRNRILLTAKAKIPGKSEIPIAVTITVGVAAIVFWFVVVF
jgi:hypothetical protein